MSTKHGTLHLALQYISGKEKWRVICCCGNTDVTLHYKGLGIHKECNRKNGVQGKMC